MVARAKVAERGQVTIPQELRKKMGIRPGTVLEFRLKGGELIAHKASSGDPVSEVFGCLGRALDTDDIMKDLRGNS